MYNRYLEQPPERKGEQRPTPEAPAPGREPPRHSAPSAEIPGGIGDALGLLFNSLSPGSLDAGDILLLLILLLLILEGDDLEIIITLGLMLLLGLDD